MTEINHLLDGSEPSCPTVGDNTSTFTERAREFSRSVYSGWMTEDAVQTVEVTSGTADIESGAGVQCHHLPSISITGDGPTRSGERQWLLGSPTQYSDTISDPQATLIDSNYDLFFDDGGPELFPAEADDPEQPGLSQQDDSAAVDSVENANQFFISQFRNEEFNPNGPASSNDCGPASLAMIARHHGVSFEDPVNGEEIDAGTDNVDEVISGVRGVMTGNHDSDQYTTVTQIKTGAEAMGLETSAVEDIDALDAELAEGHMVVLLGNPVDYQKDLGIAYGRGGTVYDGGHFVSVVGRQGEDYIVSDPANHDGSFILTRDQVVTYMDNYTTWGDYGVAVYP